MRFTALLALSLALAPAAMATDNDLRSVAGMQHHVRVLLVFAPALNDPRLVRQQGEMAKFALGAAARDLSFVQVASGHVLGAKDDARKLQRKYQVPADAFRALLIGKDGHVALSENGPIAAARLQSAIDAMPMRQEEVRRAREGRGKAQN